MVSGALRNRNNLADNTSGFFLKLIRRKYVSVTSRSVMERACKDGELRVFIVAGEVSGDTIGSRLMASLKKLSPATIRFSGVGG